MNASKKRVVILGGGVGSMSAAFAITSLPDWKERYASVDVYQMGWRLGGKGASGRQQDDHDRVLEHGIHLWMGFYENAFRTMRALYAELDRPAGAPLRTVEEAFTPQNQVGITAQLDPDAGTWSRWWIDMPVGPGQPGDGTEVLTLPAGMVQRLLGMLKACALHLVNPSKFPAPMQVEVVPAPPTGKPWPAAGVVGELYAAVEAALAAAREAEQTHSHQGLVGLIDDLRAAAAAALPVLLHSHPTLLMIWQVMDFGLATVRGMVADGVLTGGFDVIDDEDWLDWLQRHGMTNVSANSPIVRAGYDLVFAYPDGRDRPPRFAAGAMTRSLLRIALSYKGSVMYHMSAGMGDVVFAPFYQVLKARGVRFFFFHKVTDIQTTDDGATVARILLDKQVALRSTHATAYQPLYDVKGLPCWPSEPLWDQLKNGAKLKKQGVQLESAWDHTSVGQVVLENGKDFDTVVLGIPAEALKFCAKGLIAGNAGLRNMLAGARSVEVVACQAWLKPSAATLGCHADGLVMTGEAPTTDTYADMSPVLARESWGNSGEDPQSLAYFCGGLSGPVVPPLDDPTYPEKRLAQAQQQVSALYRRRSGRIWPGGTSSSYPDGTDPGNFVAPAGTEGEARWAAQYTRVNIDPTERFSMTMPGTTRERLWPHDNGFTNLALAGDWTRTPINAACVEGSVMSGLLAARKVTGHTFEVAGATDFPLTGSPSAARGTGTEPQFIEQIGPTSGPGPLQLDNVRALLLLLAADPTALGKWVDATFTQPTGGAFQFRPLVSAVLVQWAVIGSIASKDPVLGPILGWFPEVDCGLWVPVGRGKEAGGVFIVDRIYLAPAILFVNHPTGHTSGRESWGYPKQRGIFENPKSAADPGPFTAQIHVVRTANDKSEFGEIFRVTANSTPSPGTPFQDAGSALASLLKLLVGESQQRMVPGLRLADELVDMVQMNTPVLFLKQLRSSTDPTRACFQEVQESMMQTQFVGGQLLGSYRMEITEYLSHPIAATLGLQPQSDSLAAAWMEFKAEIANSTGLQ